MIRRIKEWIDPPLKPPVSYEVAAQRTRLMVKIGSIVSAGLMVYGAYELFTHQIEQQNSTQQVSEDVAWMAAGVIGAPLLMFGGNRRADNLEAQAWQFREREARYQQSEGVSPNTYAVAPNARWSANELRALLGDPDFQTGIFEPCKDDDMPILPPESGPAANGEA